MENKYKDYLLEIYKIEAEKYNKSRDIQWRINISVWTVALLGIHFKQSFFINFSGGYCYILSGILLSIFFFIIHFLFIKAIHDSTNRSLSRMNNIAKILTDSNVNNENVIWGAFEYPPIKKGLGWELIQLFFTLFLLIIFCVS